MASVRSYTWTQGDDLWLLPGRFMAESGYTDMARFVEDIRQANLGPGTSNILLWGINPLTGASSPAPGTTVNIPYAGS